MVYQWSVSNVFNVENPDPKHEFNIMTNKKTSDLFTDKSSEATKLFPYLSGLNTRTPQSSTAYLCFGHSWVLSCIAQSKQCGKENEFETVDI